MQNVGVFENASSYLAQYPVLRAAENGLHHRNLELWEQQHYYSLLNRNFITLSQSNVPAYIQRFRQCALHL